MLALTDNGGTLAGGVTIAAGATLDATQNINGSQDYAYVMSGLTLNGAANLGAAGGTHLWGAALRERQPDAGRQRHGDVRQ